MAAAMRKFECYECSHKWEEPYGTGRPGVCPACGSRNIHRAAEDRGRRGAWAGCPRTPMRGRGGPRRGR